MFLKLTGVITPAIGFANSDVEVKLLDYGSVSTFTEKVKFGLDTDNKWDLECKFVVDKEYIAEYNADNGTNFKVLPEGTYTVPEMVTLPNGTTNMELEVTIMVTNWYRVIICCPLRLQKFLNLRFLRRRWYLRWLSV